MRTINIWICLLFLPLIIIGCDDDNDDYRSINVLSATSEYEAEGGKGEIVTDGLIEFTATSDQSWCTPSVSDHKVILNLESNRDISERTAKITLTSKKGNLSKIVVVIQAGSRFIVDPDGNSDLVYDEGVYKGALPFAGGEFQLEVRSELGFEVDVLSGEWVEYKVDNSIITIKAGASTKPRVSKLKLSTTFSNGKTISRVVEITQSAAYEELLGNWVMSYGYSNKHAESNLRVNVPVEIKENVPGVSYLISGVRYANQNTCDLLANYNHVDGSFTIPNGQFMGNMENAKGVHNIHNCIFTITGTSGDYWGYTYSYWTGCSVKFDYNFDSDDVEMVLGNNKSWDYKPDGFVTYGFKSKPPQNYGDDNFGWWTFMYHIKFNKE